MGHPEYMFERDAGLRGYGVSDIKGRIVAVGVYYDKGCRYKVPLCKITLFDSMLRAMGATGLLDKFVREDKDETASAEEEDAIHQG